MSEHIKGICEIRKEKSVLACDAAEYKLSLITELYTECKDSTIFTLPPVKTFMNILAIYLGIPHD